MRMDTFFKRYEDLVKQVDVAFEKVKQAYEQCVQCKVGCADCCYALFDLTLIEAMYIKSKFDAMEDGETKSRILERSNKADRTLYKLKRRAFKDHEAGKSENEILEEMANHRVRCPALNEHDRCEIYTMRPITCRLYGIPTVIGGRGHTCGLSRFEPGQAYPTVKLDAIHQRLYEISFDLARSIESRYPKLAEMLVPLSMALLTDYTEAYLGVKDKTDETARE